MKIQLELISKNEKMKKILFFSFMIVVSCGFQKENFIKIEPIIVGVYKFMPDSVSSSSQFHESLQLKEDSSFIYKTRRGGFIRLEISGNWKYEKGNLILNSNNYISTKITTCEDTSNQYKIKIRDLEGEPISAHLILNNGERTIRDIFREVTVNNISQIRNIQIVATSGISSPVLDVSKKQEKCYMILFPNKRQFNDEKWEVKNNTLMPVGFDGKPTKYLLYKQ